MENVVDFPFPGKCKTYRKWGNDFLNLEGAMILVVQLLRGSACSDVAPIVYDQGSHLICRGFFSGWVRVSVHSFLRGFQAFSGFLVYGLHPMRIDFAGQVQWFFCRWVDCSWVEPVIGIKQGHPIPYCDRIVVGKFGHW